MNVGAPTPAEEKPHDVSDFSEDVTAEILGKDDAIVSADEELANEQPAVEELTDEQPADEIQAASQVSKSRSQLDIASH